MFFKKPGLQASVSEHQQLKKLESFVYKVQDSVWACTILHHEHFKRLTDICDSYLLVCLSLLLFAVSWILILHISTKEYKFQIPDILSSSPDPHPLSFSLFLSLSLTSPVLIAEIRKTPNVAQANDFTSHGQKKLCLVGPLLSLLWRCFSALLAPYLRILRRLGHSVSSSRLWHFLSATHSHTKTVIMHLVHFFCMHIFKFQQSCSVGSHYGACLSAAKHHN